MARKIFVSYKYHDYQVENLAHVNDSSSVRDYVDLIETTLKDKGHIYKGEPDGEDLSGLSEEAIAEKLKPRIFDSSVTLVMVSKGMKDHSKGEKDQWIPWEISYSLKEMTRGDKTSLTNAVIAIVLPDENGDYDYLVEENICNHCDSCRWHVDRLFSILYKNMFNRNEKKPGTCDGYGTHEVPHVGKDHSYIYPVKWDIFAGDIEGHLSHAEYLKDSIEQYDVYKNIPEPELS